jgi:hypothetical protein
MDWFNSRYSNSDLAEILSDYSKSVTGFRDRRFGAGRATLANALESLDRFVANPDNRAYLEDRGFSFPEEVLSPYATCNS